VALAPSITVNCVVPGLKEGTRMFARVPPQRVAAQRDQAVLKRLTDLEDVARQVVLFCRAQSITGQTQVIDGGTVFHRFQDDTAQLSASVDRLRRPLSAALGDEQATGSSPSFRG
jgi:hypothetical protein